MITRGIVEKIIDQYSVKVRIPILDKVGASDAATPTDELNTAVICTGDFYVCRTYSVSNFYFVAVGYGPAYFCLIQFKHVIPGNLYIDSCLVAVAGNSLQWSGSFF